MGDENRPPPPVEPELVCLDSESDDEIVCLEEIRIVRPRERLPSPPRVVDKVYDPDSKQWRVTRRGMRFLGGNFQMEDQVVFVAGPSPEELEAMSAEDRGTFNTQLSTRSAEKAMEASVKAENRSPERREEASSSSGVRPHPSPDTIPPPVIAPSGPLNISSDSLPPMADSTVDDVVAGSPEAIGIESDINVVSNVVSDPIEGVQSNIHVVENVSASSPSVPEQNQREQPRTFVLRVPTPVELPDQSSSTRPSSPVEVVAVVPAEDSLGACFKIALTEVLSHSRDLVLPAELDLVEEFRKLPGTAQDLYLAMVEDVPADWMERAEVLEKYGIGTHDDLYKLDDVGFIECQLGSVAVQLSSLPVEHLMQKLRLDRLQKMEEQLGLEPSQTKEAAANNIIDVVLNECGKSEDEIKSQLLSMLAPSYRLYDKAASVFRRILLLFSPPWLYTESGRAVFNQIRRLQRRLEASRKCPKVFRIWRGSRLFETREEFVVYAKACEAMEAIREACRNKLWEEALYHMRTNVEEPFLKLMRQPPESDLQRPEFLRRYTLGSVLCFSMTTCLRALEAKSLFEESVDVLRELLNQEVYLRDFRGFWFENVIGLLLEKLKQPDDAVHMLRAASDDLAVGFGRRKALQDLTTMILRSCYAAKQKKGAGVSSTTDDQANAKKKKQKMNPQESVIDLGFSEQEAAEKYSLYRKLLFHNNAELTLMNGKPWNVEKVTCIRERMANGEFGYWVTRQAPNGKGETKPYATLEDVVIGHQKQKGFTMATHGKGKTWTTVFALLFWDILYESLPDAFLSTIQLSPVDIHSSEFYERRKQKVDNRLAEIRENAVAVLRSKRQIWDTYAPHKYICLVNWDKFESFEALESLVQLLGSKFVGDVCEKMAKSFRFAREGMPDLVVWSPSAQAYLIIQVKPATVVPRSDEEYWIEMFATKFQASVVRCEVFVTF